MYTPEQIVTRANELGIVLVANGEKIKLIAADKSLITDKMRSVIRQYKPALLDYLATQEMETWLTEHLEPALCSVCYEPAADEPDAEGSLYCAKHHPASRAALLLSMPNGQRPLDHPVVQKLASLFNASMEMLDTPIDEYIARQKRALEHKTDCHTELPARPDELSVLKRKTLSCLAKYDVSLATIPCAQCGCQIIRNCLGARACAKCEPHGLWTDAIRLMIAATCKEEEHA